MNDEDKTVLMCLDDNDAAPMQTHTTTSTIKSEAIEQSVEEYKSTNIPFMYSKQNQPFLKALRALYYEIYLVERGESRLNSTRLRERIIQKMDSHMKALAELGYENTHIMIIRYILSTFIDELLGAVQWKGADGWLHQHSVLGHYYQETYGGEKFFQLLTQFLKEPSKYMQHMKLMYICLSLGYKGKYARLKNDNGQVEKVRQELYAHIKNYDVQEEKFYKDHPVSMKKHKLTFDISYRIFAIGGLLVLSIIYFIFTNMVKNNETHLINILNQAPIEKKMNKEEINSTNKKEDIDAK